MSAYGCIMIPVIEEDHLSDICQQTRISDIQTRTHLLVVKIDTSHERIVHRMDDQGLSEKESNLSIKTQATQRTVITPKRPSVY
jgi:hypothetical protein